MAKDIHLYPSGCLLCAHFELKMEKQDLQAVEVKQFYADKNHTEISGEYFIKIPCLRTPLSHAHTRGISRIQKTSDEYVIKIRCLGTPLSHFAQAGQPTHIRISCEYFAIKHWLRCRDIPRIQKISDACTIKNRWLGTKTSAICADKNHRKISTEYVIKKRWFLAQFT